MQLKVRHNFLTLLAHKSNTGWHTVLNRTTQTGHDRVLRESGRGRRPLKARLAMSLYRSESGRWLPHPPAAILSLASTTQLLGVVHCLLRLASNQLLTHQNPFPFVSLLRNASLSLSRPRCVSSTGQSGTRYTYTWPQVTAIITTSAARTTLPISWQHYQRYLHTRRRRNSTMISESDTGGAISLSPRGPPPSSLARITPT